MTTLFLLIWLIPIGVNVYLDRNGAKRNYLQVFIIRGMAAIAHGILFNPHNMWDYLPVFIFQVTSYWLLFEIGLNIVTHRNDILYYDKKEMDSGLVDRFFKWIGPTAHTIAKIAALILCIISIIVIYNR